MSQTPIPDNVPGADEGTAEGLAAPGRAGAGGTIFMGKPVAFRQQFYSYRNRAQWLSIADFLARQNLRAVLQERARGAEGAPACGEAAAPRAARTLPVGNHGEIVAKEQGV